MDFKKLAQFALLAGFAAFGLGGIKYLNADARADRQTKVASQQMGFFGGVLGGMDAEMKKQAAQKEAKQFMIVGGVLIFVGVAVWVSAGPGKSEESDQRKPTAGASSTPSA